MSSTSPVRFLARPGDGGVRRVVGRDRVRIRVVERPGRDERRQEIVEVKQRLVVEPVDRVHRRRRVRAEVTAYEQQRQRCGCERAGDRPPARRPALDRRLDTDPAHDRRPLLLPELVGRRRRGRMPELRRDAAHGGEIARTARADLDVREDGLGLLVAERADREVDEHGTQAVTVE
jgi:hypothetical protein